MHPILIHIGGFNIATYGVLVAFAYLIGILWLKSERANMGLTEDEFWALIYCLFFGAIVGGKLLFMAVEWRRFFSGEMHVIRDFRYGFVFFGGFLGAIAMGWLYVRAGKKDFLKEADYFGVALPMGHWLGRLGCLMAGCCYGRPTSLPWGVRFTDPGSLVAPDLIGIPLHPTQLYEAIGDIVITVLMYRVLKQIQKGKIRTGTAFYAYFVLYSILRFNIEFFRGDDRGGFWLGFSPSQLIALGCVLVLVPLIWHNGVWTKKSKA